MRVTHPDSTLQTPPRASKQQLPESDEENLDVEEEDDHLDSDDFPFVPFDDLEEALNDVQLDRQGQAPHSHAQPVLSAQALLGTHCGILFMFTSLCILRSVG